MLGTFSPEVVVAEIETRHRPVILDLIGDQHSAPRTQSLVAQIELRLVATESAES